MDFVLHSCRLNRLYKLYTTRRVSEGISKSTYTKVRRAEISYATRRGPPFCWASWQETQGIPTHKSQTWSEFKYKISSSQSEVCVVFVLFRYQQQQQQDHHRDRLTKRILFRIWNWITIDSSREQLDSSLHRPPDSPEVDSYECQSAAASSYCSKYGGQDTVTAEYVLSTTHANYMVTQVFQVLKVEDMIEWEGSTYKNSVNTLLTQTKLVPYHHGMGLLPQSRPYTMV